MCSVSTKVPWDTNSCSVTKRASQSNGNRKCCILYLPPGHSQCMLPCCWEVRQQGNYSICCLPSFFFHELFHLITVHEITALKCEQRGKWILFRLTTKFLVSCSHSMLHKNAVLHSKVNLLNSIYLPDCRPGPGYMTANRTRPLLWRISVVWLGRWARKQAVKFRTGW